MFLDENMQTDGKMSGDEIKKRVASAAVNRRREGWANIKPHYCSVMESVCTLRSI